MSSSISIPPPGFTARPTPPPDELMTGAPVDRGLLGESRRKLDSRRLGAWLIDSVLGGILVTPLVLHYGAGVGTEVPAAALMLAYYFICDVTTGQTIGKRKLRLRAVMADGSPLTVRAASGRSVLMLLDATFIGLAVYLLSRGRRRRIGDYAAGTIVCDVARVGRFSRPLFVNDLAYPAAWVTTGIVVLGLTASGRTPWSYRAHADHVCAGATAFLASHGTPSPVLAQSVHSQLELFLTQLRPPSNWRDRHRELLSRLHTENVAMVTSGSVAPAVSADARATMRQLGYRDCASVL